MTKRPYQETLESIQDLKFLSTYTQESITLALMNRQATALERIADTLEKLMEKFDASS